MHNDHSTITFHPIITLHLLLPNLVNPLQCGTCFDIPLYYHLRGMPKIPLTTFVPFTLHVHSTNGYTWISFQTCHFYNLHCTFDNGMYWLHSTISPPTTNHLDHTWTTYITRLLHHKFIPRSPWTSHCGMDMGNLIYFALKLRLEPILYKFTYAHSSYACTTHELGMGP